MYDELKTPSLKEASGTTKKHRKGVNAKFSTIQYNANSNFGHFFNLNDKNSVLGTRYDEFKTTSLQEAYGTTKKHRKGVNAKLSTIQYNANSNFGHFFNLNDKNSVLGT